MTEFNSEILFLEHQSNYPTKGDLYKNGNKFFKAITETYESDWFNTRLQSIQILT